MKISTHSLTRRLTKVGVYCNYDWYISTHSLTRRLTQTASRALISQSISTHSLTRRLTWLGQLGIRKPLFQLTASQGGWQDESVAYVFALAFQLTASQGGWRNVNEKSFLNEQISTHSLTRRLTVLIVGANSSPLYFNSQPHKEADVELFYSFPVFCHISTHSLTRRLTITRSGYKFTYYISTHSLTRRLTENYENSSGY